ncbi:MAG: hypothetical protein ABDI07_02840 [Candidatus Kryptonium sp.]
MYFSFLKNLNQNFPVKKILTIAWWEYITKVRTKAFLISTILMPVVIVAFSVLPTILMDKGDLRQKHIVIIDQTGWGI